MRKRFTLIELLVVIAVIAILMSILLPSLFKAKNLAVIKFCQNNMQQQYAGLRMYGEDYDEFFPYRDSNKWMECISTYVGGPSLEKFEAEGSRAQDVVPIFKCPATEAKAKGWRQCYGMSASLQGVPEDQTHLLRMQRWRSSVISKNLPSWLLMTDSEYSNYGPHGATGWFLMDTSLADGFHHRSGVNFLRGDGTTSYELRMGNKRVIVSVLGPAWGVNNIGNPYWKTW